jgi:hypothetical protein
MVSKKLACRYVFFLCVRNHDFVSNDETSTPYLVYESLQGPV